MPALLIQTAIPTPDTRQSSIDTIAGLKHLECTEKGERRTGRPKTILCCLAGASPARQQSIVSAGYILEKPSPLVVDPEKLNRSGEESNILFIFFACPKKTSVVWSSPHHYRKGPRVPWSFGLSCAPRSCRDFENSLHSNNSKSLSTSSLVLGKGQWEKTPPFRGQSDASRFAGGVSPFLSGSGAAFQQVQGHRFGDLDPIHG